MKIKIAVFFIISLVCLNYADADTNNSADDNGDNDYRVVSNPQKNSIEQKLFFPKPKEEKGYFRGEKYIEYGFLNVSGPITVDVPPLWISNGLTASVTNEKILSDIIYQVIAKGVVLDESGTEVARLTDDKGLILTAGNVVVGGYLEPVYPLNRKGLPKGEKYLGFINRNCFLTITNKSNQEIVLTPSFDGEYSENPEYADFNYGPPATELSILRPLITKQGNILGWARNNGYIYDNKGKLISIGPRCETINIRTNN